MAYFKICGGGSKGSESNGGEDYAPLCKPDLLKIIHPKPVKICKVNKSCCPFADGAVKFPVCSWFASPTYSYTCWRVRQSCCGVKCLYSDETKHSCTNNKPGKELGAKLSSCTLHGVRSVNDLRAWSLCCEERRRYFQEQMLSLSNGSPDEDLRATEEGFLETGANPVEARYESLLSRKDEEIERLKQQLLELEGLKSQPTPTAGPSGTKNLKTTGTGPKQSPYDKSVATSPDPKSGMMEKEQPLDANGSSTGESQSQRGAAGGTGPRPPRDPAGNPIRTASGVLPTELGTPDDPYSQSEDSTESSTSSSGPQNKPGKGPKKPGKEEATPEEMSRGLFGPLGDTDSEGTNSTPGSGRSSGAEPGDSDSPNEGVSDLGSKPPEDESGESSANESWKTASESPEDEEDEDEEEDRDPSSPNNDGKNPDKRSSPKKKKGAKGSPKDDPQSKGTDPGKGNKDSPNEPGSKGTAPGSPEDDQPGKPKDASSPSKKAAEPPVEIEFSLSFDNGDGSQRPGIMKILKIKDGRVIEEMDPGRNNGAQLLSLSCNDDNTCEAEISSDNPEPSMFSDNNGEVAFEIELPNPNGMDDYPYDYPSESYPPSYPMPGPPPREDSYTDVMNKATDTIYRLHQTLNRMNDRTRNQARNLQQRHQSMGGGMGDRLIQVERFGGPQQ